MVSADRWRRYLDAYERMLWRDWEAWVAPRRGPSDEAMRLACWLEDEPAAGEHEEV